MADNTFTSAAFKDNGAFVIPPTQLGKIEDSVKDGSVLAALSPERPTLFGDVTAVRMTRKPRAQILAEREQKTSDKAEWESVTASPVKFQTTVRMTNEVKWLDEDHKLQIVADLVDGIGDSMSRAVDLIGLHGINPITGQRATSVTSYLNQTEQRVTIGDPADPDGELEAAVGAIVDKYTPSGLALDSRYAFQYATQRYQDGRRVHPEAGFGQGLTNVAGMTAVSSNVVSGQPEAADTNLRALVGDWSQVRWGFQRRIPVERIEYGDPDGNGDLKGHNEIAYRAEGVIYVAIFNPDAFAAIDAAAPADGGA